MNGSNDPFLDRLNDYLDAELEPRERRALESHVETCENCARALRELQGILRTAQELPEVEPPPEVWDAIAVKLPSASSERRARSWGRGLYGALAVAATLVLSFGLWAVLRPEREPAPPADSQALANMVTGELRAAESHYDKAIKGLEQIIAQNGGALPPELASVLDQNLDLIEGAIAESRAAIRTEPDSTVAQESLLDALRKKVSLLQNTILLINEIRKGEGENALDLIDEMRKTKTPSNPI